MLLFQIGMFDSCRMKNFASGCVLEYRMAIGLGKYLTHLWDCFLCVACDIDNIQIFLRQCVACKKCGFEHHEFG